MMVEPSSYFASVRGKLETMAEQRSVSVIIPTMGLRARADLLWRSIENVLDQESVNGVPIIVLNGQEPDPEVEMRLASNPRVRVVRLETASLPASLEAGRGAVDTPWFAELDDDDFFLPGALALRVKSLEDHPGEDVVVTNGYRGEPSGEILHVESMDEVARDPLRALTHQNWLLPGSWLCRTETVDLSLFQRIPPFLECTYLAICFATRVRTMYLQEPTVVWNTGTPASASKSPDYVLSAPKSLQRILELDLPTDIKAEYERRMSAALHDGADWHHSNGETRKAWSLHMASLRWPGGLRYLPYTRHLLLKPPGH